MFNRLLFLANPAVMLSSSMAVLLTACGGGNQADTPENQPQQQAQLAAAPAADGATPAGTDTTTSPSMDTGSVPPQATTVAATFSYAGTSTAATSNLALNRWATASSQQTTGTPAAAATDGQSGSRWSSQFSDAQWLTVDLGTAMPVNHVTLQWEAAFGKDYAIQTSTDGSNWRTVYNRTGGTGGYEDLHFASTSARWVRMYGIHRGTSWGYSLWELGVYQDATASNALPTDAIFAPTSFWYQQIPANVTLNSNSAGYVSDFLRQIRTYYGNVAINTTSYASPVYQAAAGQSTTKVSQWDCQNKGYLDANLAQQWSAVPIPSYATPSDGSDGEMSVYQPSSNQLWEFWVTRKVNGQWQACWGGHMQNVSTSNGIWPLYYGTTATGLPFIGGQITAEELKRGEIRHAIGIALVDLEKSGIYSWPANRSDGYNPYNAANRIPEGSRFRLDPTLDVNSIAMHPVARIIAKAAQKYGFVVWDKAGAISLRVQNPKSYTALGQPDPYVALFNGTPQYAILNGFPWSRLQFLPKDYGKQ